MGLRQTRGTWKAQIRLRLTPTSQPWAGNHPEPGLGDTHPMQQSGPQPAPAPQVLWHPATCQQSDDKGTKGSGGHLLFGTGHPDTQQTARDRQRSHPGGWGERSLRSRTRLYLSRLAE